MRIIKLPFNFLLTFWVWKRGDGRQKKPTVGFGLIIERR
jgi:hypothetical protein